MFPDTVFTFDQLLRHRPEAAATQLWLGCILHRAVIPTGAAQNHISFLRGLLNFATKCDYVRPDETATSLYAETYRVSMTMSVYVNCRMPSPKVSSSPLFTFSMVRIGFCAPLQLRTEVGLTPIRTKGLRNLEHLRHAMTLIPPSHFLQQG